jgi:hypothetical protein
VGSASGTRCRWREAKAQFDAAEHIQLQVQGPEVRFVELHSGDDKEKLRRTVMVELCE